MTELVLLASYIPVTACDSALSLPSQESRNCRSVLTRLLSTGCRGTILAAAASDPSGLWSTMVTLTAMPYRSTTPQTGEGAFDEAMPWSRPLMK